MVLSPLGITRNKFTELEVFDWNPWEHTSLALHSNWNSSLWGEGWSPQVPRGACGPESRIHEAGIIWISAADRASETHLCALVSSTPPPFQTVPAFPEKHLLSRSSCGQQLCHLSLKLLFLAGRLLFPWGSQASDCPD